MIKISWRKKLIGLFTLILIAQFLVQVLYIIPFIQDREVNHAETHQTDIANDVSRELDISLNKLAHSLVLIAENIAFRNMEIDNQTKIIFQYLNLTSEISYLFVMNETGWFVTGSAENMSSYYTRSYDFADFFFIPFLDGVIHFASPMAYFNNTLIATYVSVPIKSETGETMGVFLGTIILNNLIRVVSDYPREEEHTVSIVDNGGIVIAHSEIDLFSLEEGPLSLNYSSHILVQQFISGNVGGTQEYIRNGTSYIGIIIIIESCGWGIVVETPKDKIWHKSNVLVQNLLLFNIIIFILASVVTLILTQQITLMQKRAKETIMENEERLRAFMDSATDGFIVLDSQLNFLDLNKVALDPLGKTKDELVGENILDSFTHLRGTDRIKMYKNVIETGDPISIDNIKLNDRYYTVNAFRVGEGLGVITHDITDAKYVEETRLKLEQERSKFVWMTNHELRTPLTVIIGYIGFLEKNISNFSQDRKEKIFGAINSNLSRFENLLDEVLLIPKFEQGIFKIVKTEFNLKKFLQEVKEEYKTLLGKQFKVDAFQFEFPLIIESDQNRLRQVLDNVLNNAVKHTHPQHRLITLSLTISHSIIRIIITDNGAGITPDNLERIFDQFVSIDSEYAVASTGIGLFLSRKIMETLGGSITAQSQGLGHGTTFIIELPIV